MSSLLTKQELQEHLLDFRAILRNFDYSSIKNIRFINLEALYAYMENIEDNPFQMQYTALQKKLDLLQPYLPFTSSDRAADFLSAISTAKDDEEVYTTKKDYTQKLRMDFINLARTTTTDKGWHEIINACEEIRMHKEEMIFTT